MIAVILLGVNTTVVIRICVQSWCCKGDNVESDSSVIERSINWPVPPKPFGRNGKSKKAKKAKIEILLQLVAS